MFRIQQFNRFHLVRKLQSNHLRTITTSKNTNENATANVDTVDAAAATKSTDASKEFTKLQFRYTTHNSVDIKIQIARMKSLLEGYGVKWSFIRLPQDQETITLYRSPHVHKKAKDHYRKFTYKAIVNAKVPSYLALKIVRNANLNPIKSLQFSVKMIDH